MIVNTERLGIQDPAVTRQIEYMCERLSGLLSKVLDQDGNLLVADPNLAITPIGALIPFAGDVAPTGYLLCDGSAVSRVKYNDLFRVIGTTYGAGNGTTTFNLPDMTGRFPLGKRNTGAGSNLGDTGGAFDHAHSVGAHTHSAGTLATSSAGGHDHGDTASANANVSGTTGDPVGPSVFFQHDDGGDYALLVGNHQHSFSDSGTHSHGIATDGAHTHTVSGSTGSSSGGDSGAANPPYIAVNYLVFTGVAA